MSAPASIWHRLRVPWLEPVLGGVTDPHLWRPLIGLRPLWFPHYVTLQPRETLRDRFVIHNGGLIVAIMQGATVPGAGGSNVASKLGFRGQVYDATRKWRFASQAITSFNLGGSGSEPFFLSTPHPISPSTTFLGRYTNLDPKNVATIEVVFLIYTRSIIYTVEEAERGQP
jgi:hypothetical protein